SSVGYAKILCAEDLTQSSVQVIEYAAGFAQTLGAGLNLVHVVPASESLTAQYFDTDFVAACLRRRESRSQAAEPGGDERASVDPRRRYCARNPAGGARFAGRLDRDRPGSSAGGSRTAAN